MKVSQIGIELSTHRSEIEPLIPLNQCNHCDDDDDDDDDDDMMIMMVMKMMMIPNDNEHDGVYDDSDHDYDYTADDEYFTGDNM